MDYTKQTKSELVKVIKSQNEELSEKDKRIEILLNELEEQKTVVIGNNKPKIAKTVVKSN